MPRPGLYASKLPARDHTADAAELVRLAALFASLPANETAKHRDQLAQASGDLDAVLERMMG